MDDGVSAGNRGWKAVATLAAGVLGCLLSACAAPVTTDSPTGLGDSHRGAQQAPGNAARPHTRERARAQRPSLGRTVRQSPLPAPVRRGPRRHARTYLVTHVVDGDTLDLANGRTIRLVGIDAPEVGECGHDAATALLTRLALGNRVRLSLSDEDHDRYGRLLRYVDVGRVDAGLRLIRAGLAIARYDSRDGYGYHPREPRYVAADRASPNVGCAAEPRPLVPARPQRPKGRSCAPGYTPCVPPYPPDVDCADVGGPIRVTGPDPHGLDADGDGWACE